MILCFLDFGTLQFWGLLFMLGHHQCSEVDMQTWIAFLRGINVGGNHIIKMAELRALLSDMGYQQVKTYIQSGNVVFKSEEETAPILGHHIGTAIEAQFGFRPRVYVISLEDLESVKAESPFLPEPDIDPKTVHFFFLMAGDEPSLENKMSILDYQADDESFFMSERCFHFHAPSGLGRSKLADKLDRCLGLATTGRNARTLQKVLDLAHALD